MTQARAKGLAAHHHQPPTGALAVCTGELLAWADHERGLHVHRLRGSGGGGGRSSSSSSAGGSNSSSLLPVARCALTAVVGCLAWHRAASGAWQLLSGDADGQVCVWQLPPEPSSSSSSSAAAAAAALEAAEAAPWAPLALWQADAEVLQLEAERGAVVVSTHTRSTLLRLGGEGGEGGELGGPLAIGRKLRDGHYGACFVPQPPAAFPTAVLVAARPGRRLWLVDGQGAVLSTLKLPAPHSAPHAAGAEVRFGRLAALCGPQLAAALGPRQQGLWQQGLLLSYADAEGSAQGSGAAGGEAGVQLCVLSLEQVQVLTCCVVRPSPVWHAAVLDVRVEDGAGGDGGGGEGGDGRLLLELVVVHGVPRRLSRLTLPVPLPRPAHPPTLPPSLPLLTAEALEAAPPPDAATPPAPPAARARGASGG